MCCIDLMGQVCEWFEVVIFTASVRQYADCVIDRLDRARKVCRRLFREVRSKWVSECGLDEWLNGCEWISSVN